MFLLHITPAFYDTDGLGHINNTRVPQWLEAARNDVFRIFTPDLDMRKWQLILARIEVDFVGELFYASDVEVRTSIGRIGSSSFGVHQEVWQNGALGAKGEATLVRYDFSVGKTMPLSEDQRTQLQQHMMR